MAMNNSYLESFKMMVVEKYMSGMTKTEIMRQFGISSSTLYNWKLKCKELVRTDYVPAAKAFLAEAEFVDVTEQYVLKRWDGFTAYLGDGRVEMSNNVSERAVKPFVIDRKNFLFSFTENGAESSAMYFSLQQTARANGLDPKKYVAKAIELAAFMNPEKDDYSALLPWNLSKEYDLS